MLELDLYGRPTPYVDDVALLYRGYSNDNIIDGMKSDHLVIRKWVKSSQVLVTALSVSRVSRVALCVVTGYNSPECGVDCVTHCKVSLRLPILSMLDKGLTWKSRTNMVATSLKLLVHQIKLTD